MTTNTMKRIAVLGADVMGHSISLVFAQHGYVVRLCDLTDQFLDRDIRLIKSRGSRHRH